MLWALIALVEAAPPVQLTAGARTSMSTAGVDGLKVGARSAFGPLAVELNAFGNPAPARYDSLDETLVLIARNGEADVEFQAPVRNDVFALQVLADFGFLPLDQEGWSGGPHLYAGLEGARVYNVYALSFDETAAANGSPSPVELSKIDTKVAPFGGLVTGAGADIWYQDRFGARVTWTSRTRLESDPQYDPNEPSTSSSITFNPTVTVDVLVALW